MLTQELLTREEAAELLGIRPQTLAAWKCLGRQGPPYVRVGMRAIRYRRSDLEAWLAARTVQCGEGV